MAEVTATVTLVVSWETDSKEVARKELTELVELINGDAFNVESVGNLEVS